MKIEDMYIGLEVAVAIDIPSRSGSSTFEHSHRGKTGKIREMDTDCELSVSVRFSDGSYDWGSHKDIEPLNQEDLLRKGSANKSVIEDKLVTVRRLLSEIEALL